MSLNRMQYKMVAHFLNRKISAEHAFDSFTESELREATGFTTPRSGKTFGWRHILVYMLSSGNIICSDFLSEVISNTLEEITTLNNTEMQYFCKRFKNLMNRVEIKIETQT